jgi:hypothetical protein
MVRQSSGEQHHPAERLASRHIFLDTQVYRALGHNPANRALALLKEQVNSHRVVLHTTDITLLEGFWCGTAKSRETQTLRWREKDPNPRSP